MISERVKAFLILKQDEYENKIRKYKTKYLIIKILYGVVMGISICSGVLVASSSLGIPLLAVSILGGVTSLTSALSVQFNLKGNKNKMQKTIFSLNRIKTKLDYIITCNGDLNDEEYLKILKEFELY